MRTIDLKGKRFGMLLVLRQVKSGLAYNRIRSTGSTSALWLCKCDCGTVKVIKSYQLRGKGLKSCGCMVGVIPETGNRYGRLTVIKRVTSGPDFERIRKYSTSAIWLCKCDCGNDEVYVRGITLRRKNPDHNPVRSCGCLQEDVTSVMHSKNVEPIIWVDDDLIRQRIATVPRQYLKNMETT